MTAPVTIRLADAALARCAGGAARRSPSSTATARRRGWSAAPRATRSSAWRSSDVDIATTALPQEVMRRAAAAGIKAVPTGIEHGTVTLVIDGIPFEVTTLREDVETFGRKANVAFGRDWKVDAERRDFTINALSITPDGIVHDYVGGLDDLARAPGSLHRRSGAPHRRGLPAHPALLPLPGVVLRRRARQRRAARLHRRARRRSRRCRANESAPN